ncbi:molybdenum cofactor guanylyltransferase [Bacillus sp. NPDC077027]|uniref:molybdenum cofactor guanylyltransferase n=1 Tax=Bacillus sp. NPDC077027 TaxID=3390548 RepID=UPI003D047F04
MKILHVILAGGQSRRFGELKASYRYKGRPLYQLVKEQLPNEDLMIISHPDLVSFFQEEGEKEVFLDIEDVRGKGPLAGIYTAMQTKKAEWYMVVACDMPFIQGLTVERLKAYCDETFDAIVPNIHGRLQPLFSIYHRRSLLAIEQSFKKNQLSMKDFFNHLHVRYVTEKDINASENEFKNINERRDLHT